MKRHLFFVAVIGLILIGLLMVAILMITLVAMWHGGSLVYLSDVLSEDGLAEGLQTFSVMLLQFLRDPHF